MRRLQKASLRTFAHKQTVIVFECVFASSKVPAQCSNAHRTADRVTSGSIAIASTGCQANHANVFHNLGGLDMRGLMKASLCAPKSCLKAHKQTVTVFECAFTSFKVSAQCREKSKSLSPALRAAFLRDLCHTLAE